MTKIASAPAADDRYIAVQDFDLAFTGRLVFAGEVVALGPRLAAALVADRKVVPVRKRQVDRRAAGRQGPH